MNAPAPPPKTSEAAGEAAARIIPWIVACALLMQNLDSTAVTTAVPVMAKALHVAPIKLSAAVTSYVLAVAVFLAASGWAADRFGARTIFAMAIALFTCASVACGMTNDLTALVIARVVQGIGGSMMVPVGRLVLIRSVPRNQLISAMARTTAPALVGPALGPLAGGFLTTYASWRWIFFINVPIGIIGIGLVYALIPNFKEERDVVGRFDGLGFVLSGVALGALVFGLEAVSRSDVTTATMIGAFVVAGLSLAIYVRHARRRANPVLDPTLFAFPAFAAGVGGGSLFRLGAGALPFLMPMLLQVGFGLSALASGSITFSTALGAMVAKSFARPLLRRFGFRMVLSVNGLLSGIILASYALFRPTTPHALIILSLFVGGMLRSIQFTSMNSVTYADLPAAVTSRANTVANVAQQLSISVGVATAAAALHITQITSGAHDLQAWHFGPAFLLIGAASWASGIFFSRLPSDAGAEMTGHVRRGA
jgi:EmrB/QacA subfamily drug resistance transporter